MSNRVKNKNFIIMAILIAVITAILIAVFLIILFILIFSGDNKNDVALKEKETETHAVILEADTGDLETEPQITTPPPKKVTEDETETEDEDEVEIETEPAETKEPAREPETPKKTRIPVKVKKEYQNKFDRLRAKYNNNDIIGIIKIPGSVVYYPVAHNPESTDYYLDRNLYRQKSSAGSIVLDHENSIERQDPNTVIYGHQMYSNSMFHTLNYYRDENFFNNHRYVIYNTIYEDNVWEVFAFFKTHTNYTEFPYIKVFFKSEQDFLKLAAEMKKRSMYETGIEIAEGDRILTLSTCTNLPGEADYRYVLCARMIKNKDDIPENIAIQMANAVDEFK